MLFLSIKDTQKESNSVDTCYHKSVSTVSIQCLARECEEGSTFWKAVTLHMKSIQQSEEDSNSYLVCQFPKQRLMLCHCFSVLLRYWRYSVQLAFAWFSFGTHWTQFFFSIFEALVSHSRKTFVITRDNANTFFLCILNGPQPHLPILALFMVLTQLNIWCANLFDMIVWPD